MPFNLGPGELFLLGIAALLIFGPKKLPEIGRSLGEALGSLKKAYNSASTLESGKASDSAVKSEAAPPPPAAPASVPTLSESAAAAAAAPAASAAEQPAAVSKEAESEKA
ncbi:twin-arginine translocase TatA/TatE family subunit [bacterium]|nr:twin-arginine translocase TatA/TatE family subunit [bacterium]